MFEFGCSNSCGFLLSVLHQSAGDGSSHLEIMFCFNDLIHNFSNLRFVCYLLNIV